MPRPEPTTAAPRAPRFALAWASLIFALCTLVLGYRALGGGFLVTDVSDQYLVGYAFREFAASSLRSGQGFPLWNPYLFGGVPYVAGMAGDIFYPTFLLRMALPTDVAMTWSFVLHVFLAGLFTYAFLRAWGLSFSASVAGGVAYLMSGPVAGLVSPGHDGKLYISALFPLTLWMLLRAVRDGRAWGWGVLALVIGLAVLTPHPQLLQYLLLASGAFALYVALATHRGVKLARPLALRRLALAMGAVLLGGIIGAIQYLPVREYVPWSPRAGGLSSYELATSYSMPPEELLNTYLPQFSGILDAYWGRNGIHFHSEYLGAAVLVLALAAFGRSDSDGQRTFRRFWLGTLIVAVLWALGGFTPFYHLIYALVPGTRYFRAPSTMLFLVAFATSVLAALGVERLLAKAVSRRYLIGWIAAAALIAVFASIGGLTGLAVTLAPEGRVEVAQANRTEVIFGAWRSFLVVALAAGLSLAYLRGRMRPSHLAAALVAVVAADLWSVERRYWRFSPSASVVYGADATIEHMRRATEPGRVLAVPLGSEMAYHDPFLQGGSLMVHRIRNVLGYHGNELGRYQALFGKNEGGNQIFNPNFLALANVRWFLTNVPAVPIPGLERVVGPVKNAAGTTVYLFEFAEDRPAAWVAPVIVKAPDEAVYSTVLNQAFDLRRAALFDTAAPVVGRQITAVPERLPIAARVTRLEAGQISVELDAPAPEGSALVVSENYYPGWSATADGRPAATGRADYSLIGVALPTGARRVELSFADPAYRTGKAVTLLALALTGLLILGGVVRERRGGG